MSRAGSVNAPLGGKDRHFRLGIRELAELQEATALGPHALLQRIARNEWRAADLADTIRLGLIGGGRHPEKAARLVRRHIQSAPRARYAELALTILIAALIGPADEQVGQKSDGEDDGGDKIKFAGFYGTGMVLGLSPAQVGDLSLWEFIAAVDGYVKANDQDGEKKLSDKEKEALWAKVDV